jgi:hypothetical protein
VTQSEKDKFIDALELELDGQELMLDEHEWLTSVVCLKRALDTV